MALAGIPIIDPSVKYVGVSKLRGMTSDKLKQTEETLVIQENDTPLAVLLSYEKYLIIQQHLMSMVNTVEVLSDETERNGLVGAFEDIRAGRVRSLAEIEAELEKE